MYRTKNRMGNSDTSGLTARQSINLFQYYCYDVLRVECSDFSHRVVPIEQFGASGSGSGLFADCDWV